MKYDVRDIKLAAEGKLRIEWAEQDMPVLGLVKERFAKEKPLKGKKMSACLHVTAETANLMRTLKAGGADLVLAIRPGVEMVPPLIALARRCDCDLLVYHLGDEVYLDGGERIPIEGAILHRYHRGGRLEEG